MATYDLMKKRIKSSGGVATATLGELREAINQARLGPYVLQDIAKGLEREGIAYFPSVTIDDNKAPRKWEEVRLILADQSNPIYKALRAIEDPNADGDAFLVSLAAAGTPVADVARYEDRLKRTRGALEDALAILDEPSDAEVDPN
ncbi:hypothetical protein [Cellulomonas citrea]|uniref:hypothetical protein n=1 Tax=Cellulomonas citrea TaxID=1909423 RepID=UPI00135BDF89|nr:hypothetical protein [Cellulomonas citrea]